MTTENFCFYLQNRLIQTSQTVGQWYSDTSPFKYSLLTLSVHSLVSGILKILATKTTKNEEVLKIFFLRRDQKIVDETSKKLKKIGAKTFRQLATSSNNTFTVRGERATVLEMRSEVLRHLPLRCFVF